MIEYLRKTVFAMVILIAVLSSCISKSNKQLGADPSGSNQSRIVNLAIWSNYIPNDLLSRFEKENGIKVQVSNYSSNEELLAKLQAGASGYDLIVPSDYMVYAMIKLGLLRALDYTQLPNSKSLDPKYLKQYFDLENKYSLPYDWGTTGIAVNRSLYSGEIKGWKDLLTKTDLAGKFSMLDDSREVIGAALKAQGFSLNSKDPIALKKARDMLKRARSRIREFTSEPLMSLVNGEVAVAQVYASDALIARKTTGGKIDYFLPIEGGTFWIDNLVIPAGAPHLNEAHKLMNFLMEGTSNLATVQSVWVAPANKVTLTLLPKELLDNPMLFPPAELMAKSEMIHDLGEYLVNWDQAWTEVKAFRE